MPIRTAQRVVKTAARKAKRRIRTASAAVRQQWTQQEADRRRQVAEEMQHHLIHALGLASTTTRSS